MAIPKYNELYGTFLKAIEDGEVHSVKDIKQSIKQMLNLSEQELLERLQSGKQTVIDNRIGWTRTYLKKAGLVDTPIRAHYVLTEAGKNALKDIDIIDNDYLTRFKSFRNFTNSEEVTVIEQQNSSNKSPEELLEDAYAELNVSLADDLMTEVMKLTPTDFEHLVVKLLLSMGYGSGIDDAGFVTQTSNDGGIDGVIKEDQLGFSAIYIQAKQWALDRSVDRPEIQKFVGALHECNAQKGLFITTASFSAGAKKSAENAGVVLVDGKQLTKLMIKYNLGVSVEHVYELKRIDSDFFAEGF